MAERLLVAEECAQRVDGWFPEVQPVPARPHREAELEPARSNALYSLVQLCGAWSRYQRSGGHSLRYRVSALPVRMQASAIPLVADDLLDLGSVGGVDIRFTLDLLQQRVIRVDHPAGRFDGLVLPPVGHRVGLTAQNLGQRDAAVEHAGGFRARLRVGPLLQSASDHEVHVPQR